MLRTKSEDHRAVESNGLRLAFSQLRFISQDRCVFRNLMLHAWKCDDVVYFSHKQRFLCSSGHNPPEVYTKPNLAVKLSDVTRDCSPILRRERIKENHWTHRRTAEQHKLITHNLLIFPPFSRCRNRTSRQWIMSKHQGGSSSAFPDQRSSVNAHYWQVNTTRYALWKDGTIGDQMMLIEGIYALN